MTNRVQLAARMYEARDALRFILGDAYRARVDEAIALIGRSGKRPIEFLPWISREMAARGKSLGDGDVLLFTAATVEAIEAAEVFGETPAG